MSPHASRLLEHSICRWHECLDCEEPRRFDDRQSGVQWLMSFRHDDAAMRQLRLIAQRVDDDRSLSRLTDDELCDRLGWLLHSDRLRVCGNNPVIRTDFAVRRPRADPEPAPRERRREIPEPPSRDVDEVTFVAQVDTDTLVRDLIEAASLGLAFCEECERARQSAPGRDTPAEVPPELPPTLDADAAVAAMIAAASAGVPFCEECERQAAAAGAAR